MALLAQQLTLPRCPYCGVDTPSLESVTSPIETYDIIGSSKRIWRVYKCVRCGGLVTAASPNTINNHISEFYPFPKQVADAIPIVAREYLAQAINSVNAPAGAVMLCASSVDAMLKAKGYNDYKLSLYKRIEQAAKDHLITEGMKDWAHEVRLDANDQRHADEAATLPNASDAKRSIDFAQALGEFLFVLPARIDRGKAEALNS